MKQPLRDWRMVSALIVLAAGSAGHNVIRPWLAGNLSAMAGAQDEQIAISDTPSDFVAPIETDQATASVARVRVTATERLPRFSAASIQGRDPFAPTQATISLQAFATIAPETSTGDERHGSLPEVTAIVVTERWRAAVIDGRFVAPGQLIGERIVTRIDPDTVQLRGTGPATVSLAYFGAAP